MPLTHYFFTNTGSIPVGATETASAVFFMPIRRFRLVARTHASHTLFFTNTGSIPVGATETASAVFYVHMEFRLVDRTHTSHTLSPYQCGKKNEARYRAS